MKKRESSTKNNLIDGKKAHHDNKFIKVGRIRMNSWANTKLPATDIFISEREIIHIANHHAKELSAIGIDALNYVITIVNQFNEIRKDDLGAYLFIVCHEYTTRNSVVSCAVVELTLGWLNKKQVYKIKTARPERYGRLSKYELICVKPRS